MVDCRIFIGLTVELAKDLKPDDFRKIDDFLNKHPELDEYVGDPNLEGRILLIHDGMDGDFARLVFVDKFRDDASLGSSNEFIELAAPNHMFNPEVISKMFDLYEDYTGSRPAISDFKYALWSQWY